MHPSQEMQDHWDAAYSRNTVEKLGWHEETPGPSIDLIEKCKLSKQAALLDVGSGATTLIPKLLQKGYQNLATIDISPVALEKARSRLDQSDAARIKWLVADITDPDLPIETNSIDLWHDRAVLHFLTDSSQQERYAQALGRVIRPGGFAIISAFAIGGATKCNGLEIVNYNETMLSDLLGTKFDLLEFFPYEYTTPSGNTRAYIYTQFQKA